MTSLPASLSRWAAPLSLFSRHLALALAPMIQRLSFSIGPLGSADEDGSGAPDGYDGVGRRGTYERLLATDWVLADVAPDEFLRRAASGEQLFYRLAARTPQQARRCVVLFDSGPRQLGSPRLVQFAALVVFAARAQAAGARLEWASLQAPGSSMQLGFTEASAPAFLKLRSTLDVTPERVNAWLAKLDVSRDDVWFVGGEGSIVSEAQRIEIRDELLPGEQRLEVGVHRAGRSVRRTMLELPPPEACVSLLRNPFRRPKPVDSPKTRSAKVAMRGPLISKTGDRLFWTNELGELEFCVVPGHLAPRRARFSPPHNELVVAAGWRKGPLCVTARRNDSGGVTHFVAYQLSKRGERRGAALEYAVSGEPLELGVDTLLPVAVGPALPAQYALQIALPHLVVSLYRDQAILTHLTIAAATPHVSGLMILTVDPSGRRVVRAVGSGEEERPIRTLDGLGPVVAHFGHAEGVDQIGVAVAIASPAEEGKEQHWHLSERRRGIGVNLAPGQPGTPPAWQVSEQNRAADESFSLGLSGEIVLGLAHLKDVPGLLVLRNDGLTLTHQTKSGADVLFVAPYRVAAASVSPRGHMVAWRDEQGHIGVFDLARRRGLWAQSMLGKQILFDELAPP